MVHTDIAVIGAGIGGLTLGLALRKHGIDVQIFEQAPELAEVGAAVALAANGTRILQDLGLGTELAAVSVVPSELVYRGWSDASRLVTHPIGDWYEREFGAPFWGIHRANLQRGLAAAWGTENLRLGKSLVALQGHGSEGRADLRRRLDRDGDLVAQHEELDILGGGRATQQQDQAEHLPEDPVQQPR